MGELAGAGSVTVAVGCWPRREGWGAEGGAAGGQEGGGELLKFFFVFNYIINKL